MGMMSGAVVSLRYALTDAIGIAIRGEYIDDNDQVVSTGLKGMGLAGCVEYKPTPTSYIRAEGRVLRLSDDYKIFLDKSGEAVPSRKEMMMTFGVWI